MNEHTTLSPLPAEHKAPMKVIPVIELVEESWKRYAALFTTVFPVLVVAFIATAILSLAKITPGPLASALLSLVGFVALIISYLALGRQLTAIEADPADVSGTLRRSLSLFFPYIWVAFLSGLVIFGGFLGFFVPAIILGVFLHLSLYPFLLENKRGLDALIQSFAYVSGRWWQVFWRILVYAVLLGVLLLFVNSVFTLLKITGAHGTLPIGAMLVENLIETLLVVPFTIVYFFGLYKSLRLTKNDTVTAEEKATARTWLTVFVALGFVAVLLFFAVLGFTSQYAMSAHSFGPGTVSVMASDRMAPPQAGF
jgi:hypothetical protein